MASQKERESKDESFTHAMDLVMSSVLSMSLKSAFELGVFDVMAKAGENAELSAIDIAAQMAGNANPAGAPAMLDRVLRLLASHDVIGCSIVGDKDGSDSRRLYTLTPVSKYFVTNEDGVSLGPLMALIQDKIFLESWAQLSGSILEGGIPFNKAYGMHAFEYALFNARSNEVINKAMYNPTTIVIQNLLEVYNGFESLKSLVDVGGGIGVTTGLITSKYPHIAAINFDLPHVIKNACSYPGVTLVGGDMFESVPHGDAIFLKWILHDWSDEDCLKLLNNCYKAIPEDGKVVIMEAILPVEPETNMSTKCTSKMDVWIMTQSPSGKERSRQEFLALATRAGFKGIRFQCSVCNFQVMECFKV